MNADAILTRIEKDAKDAAERILREAKEKAAAVEAASEARIAQEKEAALAQARQDALALNDRMERMATLEARKALLAEKRALLDEVFQAALQKLLALPIAQARAFGMQMLLTAAKGDEAIIADENAPWCDASFVNDANQALLRQGKPGNLTLAPEKRALGGGFVLRRGGMEANCSLRAALEGDRLALEPQIAALLFDA
ncbi:MAG: V-type ATP synthase subunit E [Oscillospiraceae bacterium]|jgi:V/A-type H+-transporting ATPase subunit E|nr:V-type ATP synthase subunit E [Oscillospiraceae bacterium]